MTSAFGPHPAAVSCLAAILVSVFTVGGTWWFGRRADAYRHWRDTISELGAAGTKDVRAVAWLWFAPSGLIFAVAAVALGDAFGTDDARRAASILALVGVGWIGAAIFPRDKGAPVMGTVRNHLHNLTGGGGGRVANSVEAECGSRGPEVTESFSRTSRSAKPPPGGRSTWRNSRCGGFAGCERTVRARPRLSPG